jgi:hypothetical protein
MRPGTDRNLVRLAAIAVMLAGLATIAVDLSGLFLSLWAGFRRWPEISEISPGATLWSEGALLYLLPGLIFAGRRGIGGIPRPRFRFARDYGRYILPEPILRKTVRWALALVFLAVGLFVTAASTGTFRNPAWQEINPGVRLAALLIVGVPLRFLALMLVILALRGLSPPAEGVLRRSRRRPVLYLRSFTRDAGMFESPADAFRLVTGFGGGLNFQTHEQGLQKAVADVGPVVAVGHPRERLPPRGAARLYIDRDWQTVVARLVADSSLVILRIGQTEGFWWEVRHVLATCNPSKILLYLPKEDRRAYVRFRERAAEIFPCDLPASFAGASFLAFRAGWEPWLLGIGKASAGARTRRFLFGGRAPALREALIPYLRRSGMRYARLPLVWTEWLYLILYVVAVFQLLSCFGGALVSR